MKKELKIINEVYFWKERLKVPYFVLDIDNRTAFTAYVAQFNKTVCLTLNIKALLKCPPLIVLAVIFHEFGHIIKKTYRSNFKGTEIQSEILAETYGLSTLKKYCSKEDYNHYYNTMQKSIKMKVWNKHPEHKKAFEKIYK